MRAVHLLLILLLTLLSWPAAHAQPARRVALLIGNQAYAVGALRYPTQDVATMREALLATGFKPDDVAVLHNADQKTLRRAVQQFGQRARGAEVALVYYSGHATQALGQNWLIPIGAEVHGEADYELESVSVQSLLTQLQVAAPKVGILVLDACRDNPVAVTRSGTKGLGRMDAGAGMLVAFATAPNDTAADNGLYAKVLAAQLRRPGLELLDVFRNTTAEVRRATNGRQVPRVSEVTLDERFYLAGPYEPSARPGAANGVSMDDLQREDATRREWGQWQASMKADFDKVNAFSGSNDLQLKAWERFASAWPQDNPYSRDDEELRRLAGEAVKRLRGVLQPAAALQKVTLAADAFFQAKAADIPEEMRAKLDDLAQRARGLRLEAVIAIGHADGSEAADVEAIKLSIRRADAVKAYLVRQGVEMNRIFTEGKGSKLPVAPNTTAEGRAKNRRVEIEVVGTRTVQAGG